MIKKTIISALSFFLINAQSAHADSNIGLGIGVTYVFGTENNRGFAVGAKLFSSNEENKAAASVGIDYMLSSSSFRPNIGLSYLYKTDFYNDINIGYDLNLKKINWGVGAGYTKTNAKTTKTESSSTTSTTTSSTTTPTGSTGSTGSTSTGSTGSAPP